MNSINHYWSLDCDVIAGPQEAGVKPATAGTPELAIQIVEALNAQTKQLPSCFQIGDRVKTLGRHEATVEAVRFTADKVRYDLYFTEFDTLMKEVDSYYVTAAPQA